MDSITVLVPCPTLQRDVVCATLSRDQAMERYRTQFSDPTLIGRVRSAVRSRLSIVVPLMDQVILHETVETPATYADQYHVGAGSPFGLSHGLAQLSLFRPGPQLATHPNVLFCGASTRPGNGVPLVLIGAKQVAEKALLKLKQQKRLRTLQ
jgi:phytoene dehydrogenase-like protein